LGKSKKNTHGREKRQKESGDSAVASGRKREGFGGGKKGPREEGP